MSKRAVAGGLSTLVSVLLMGGCTSRTNPGPFHRCQVVDWVAYEDFCTCDPQPLPGRDAEPEVIDEGTMVGLFVPPGSLPPGAPVVITHGSETTTAVVLPDGSLGLYLRNGGGYDLRRQQVVARVGSATYIVPLDGRDEIELRAAGVDPRFSSSDIAIEDPVGTIAMSAQVVALWDATEIEHFAVSTSLPGVREWMARPPAFGDTVTWTGPGMEGTPIGYVALHASGAASGCYAGSLGSGHCGCSVQRREAGQCRHEIVATRPDGGVDGGVIDGGEIDAGTIDPFDAGTPF